MPRPASLSAPPPAILPPSLPARPAWISAPANMHRAPFPRPSVKSLLLAIALFLLTMCTALAAGTQFAVTFAQKQQASGTELLHAYALFYRHPAGLLAGLP